MRILVVGATGTLGRQVVRRALDEGQTVLCMVRNLKKAAFLKEWGAELVRADLCFPESLPNALEGVDAIIDAATARPTDAIVPVDWDGKVALIQAAKKAGVERYILFSILNAANYPSVPLMDVKTCTEKYLAQVGMDYTILQLGGFFQGLISQYAIPILERQTVWVTGEASPIAYMDTQDIAKFAIRALSLPSTSQKTFPVMGSRAWGGYELIRLCESMSGQDAKIARMPTETVQVVRKFVGFFEMGWNLYDRLAFTEVITNEKPLTTDMTGVYETFGIDPTEIGTVETYLDEYFGRILKKLKELNFNQGKNKKKMIPF
jgi:uncharacterized protein YbjT (DUF2867 family)